jgi:hypothetical protein
MLMSAENANKSSQHIKKVHSNNKCTLVEKMNQNFNSKEMRGMSAKQRLTQNKGCTLSQTIKVVKSTNANSSQNKLNQISSFLSIKEPQD